MTHQTFAASRFRRTCSEKIHLRQGTAAVFQAIARKMPAARRGSFARGEWGIFTRGRRRIVHRARPGKSPQPENFPRRIPADLSGRDEQARLHFAA